VTVTATAADHLATVRRYYRQALTTVDAVDRLFDLLQTRYGLAPHQIVSADSICSDDVNSVEYPRRAYEMIGPFKMGGLNGFPFTGLTGMGAFASHVPVEGGVFIYHAPHVGVTADGSYGSILRSGQQKPSGCCGACRAALAKLQAGTIVAGPPDDFDYQQGTIEQLFLANRERILGAPLPLYEATEVMHEAITARIDALTARTTYDARYLIVMGSILINGDHDMGSFQCTRRLEVTDLRTGAREDLRAQLMA
jgi:hypothetical protein